MRGSRIRVTEYYRDSAGKIIRLGLIATVSAQCQALALVLVVLLTRAFTAKRTYYHGAVAGVKIDLTTMQLTGLAILMLIVAAILDTVVGWMKSTMITTWDFVHREEVVNEYLQADFATQSAERLGTLGLITGYVQRGSSMLGAITGGLVSALTLITYICYALLLDYRAAIVMVGSVVVIAICLAPVMKRIKAYGRALSAEQIHYTRDVTEATRMVRDLRVFDALDPLSKRLLARSARLNRLRQRANFVNGMVGSVYQYIGMMIVLVGLAVAQTFGTVDIVKLGAIALLLIRSLSYGQGLQGTYQNVVDGVPYLEKLEDLRDLYRSHQTVDGHLVIESVKTLELDQLRYSYDGKTDAVAGVSAKLHVGEIVGIVGPSGGGKSTLSQLLLRLREPTGGAILVDGVNAAEFKRSSWYRNVSIVPQDPRLFHASVAENIALMDKRITRDDVDRGGQGGWYPRRDRAARGRLRNPDRPRVPRPLGWSDPTHRDRPGALARCTSSGARRTDQRARRALGSRDPGDAGITARSGAGPDHRPPFVDPEHLRSHCRAARRPDRVDRNALRNLRAERVLPPGTRGRNARNRDGGIAPHPRAGRGVSTDSGSAFVRQSLRGALWSDTGGRRIAKRSDLAPEHRFDPAAHLGVVQRVGVGVDGTEGALLPRERGRVLDPDRDDRAPSGSRRRAARSVRRSRLPPSRRRASTCRSRTTTCR